MVKNMRQTEIAHALEWFKEWTGTDLPADVLSHQGIMYYGAKGPVACVFMYPTIKSKVCFIGWPIANPKASQEDRSLGLDTVIKEAEERAKLMGYSYMNTYASRSSVERRFTEHGYMVGDKNVTNMVKTL